MGGGSEGAARPESDFDGASRGSSPNPVSADGAATRRAKNTSRPLSVDSPAGLPLTKAFIVGFGGFLGSMARYWVGGLVHSYLGGGLPYGTLAVNLLGCFAIGGVLCLVEGRGTLGPEARLFFVMGILGGFTTFSAFGYETLELLRDGSRALATANVIANVALGILAVWLGWALASATSR